MSQLFEPIQIGGKTCLLIPDEVGEQPPSNDCVLLQEGGRNTGFSFWVRESELKQARTVDAHLPVYGLWQTLDASGQLDTSVPIQVYATGERTGLYVQSDQGRIVGAGSYTGGRFPYTVPHKLADATRLSIEADSLKLPRKVALSPVELIALQSRSTHRRALVGIVVGVVLSLSGLAVGWQHYRVAQAAQSHLADLRSATRAASQRVRTIEATHRVDDLFTQAHRQTLVYVLGLLLHSHHVRINAQDLAQDGFVATVNGLSADLPWATSIRPLPDGSYEVSYGHAPTR